MAIGGFCEEGSKSFIGGRREPRREAICHGVELLLDCVLDPSVIMSNACYCCATRSIKNINTILGLEIVTISAYNFRWFRAQIGM